MRITAIVPIKKDSERLKRKNFKLFGGQPLYYMILDKLQTIDRIEKIVINTDSEEIATVCNERYSKGKIIDRPDFLLGNEVTMNTLIEYDLQEITGDYFLQTHVTNPLLSIETIENAIACYFENLNKYDSLFSVCAIKKRVYDNKLKPINHNNEILEMTQNLPEILVENSNLFLFSRDSFFKNKKSRVGNTPFGYCMNEIEGIDIDTHDDFKLAELIYENGRLFNLSI